MHTAAIADKAGLCNLELASTLQDLSLWKVSVDSNTLGIDVTQLFGEEPLLIGIILTKNGSFIGMISRQRFFEYMSRPFSLGLFSGRPVEYLYNILKSETLKISENTLIAEATQMALQRSPEFAYEPILVETQHGEYAVLDFYQLLLAYSHIQTLTRNQLQQIETQSQITATNLHELQQNSIKLVTKEKIASIKQVLESVVREIKNPIDYMTGNLIHTSRRTQELLQRISLDRQDYPHPLLEIQTESNQTELDSFKEDILKQLDSMKVNSKRIQRLVRAVQNFCCLPEAEKQAVNLHDIIDISLVLLQNRISIWDSESIVILKEYGDLPQINCYVWQLIQVFINIFNNAIDSLELRYSNDLKKRIERKYSFLNPQIQVYTEVLAFTHAVIRIVDNGFGTNKEMRKQLFEPERTTKSVDLETELGLLICYQIIVEEHKGELEYISTPEQGTEFIIKIPI